MLAGSPEDRVVTISRARGTIAFLANFMLVAAGDESLPPRLRRRRYTCV